MRDERPRFLEVLRIAISHSRSLQKNTSSQRTRRSATDAKAAEPLRRRRLPPRILCVLRVKAFPFSYRSSGTIQNGFEPRATRWQLSKALRQRFGWLSQVGPAECGLKIAFFSVNSS